MSVFAHDCMIGQSNWSTDPCEWFLITWHTSPNTQPTHPPAAKKSTRITQKKSIIICGRVFNCLEGRLDLANKKYVDSLTFTFQIVSATSSGKVWQSVRGEMECAGREFLSCGWLCNYFIESFCSVKRFNWSTAGTWESFIFYGISLQSFFPAYFRCTYKDVVSKLINAMLRYIRLKDFQSGGTQKTLDFYKPQLPILIVCLSLSLSLSEKPVIKGFSSLPKFFPTSTESTVKVTQNNVCKQKWMSKNGQMKSWTL